MLTNVRERLVYIGFSPEELIASTVAEESIRRTARLTAGDTLRIRRISRHTLGDAYQRTTIVKGPHQRWDVLSQAPMTTDHAIARFFIPWLCDYQGWALFTDGDILCRENIDELFTQYADPSKAVYCVKHPPLLKGGEKKEGEVQSLYARKNWSSVMLFNCGHPANQALTLETLNTLPGRDLHRFYWLQDEEIGGLHPRWNYLVNISEFVQNPAIVHFTEGIPMLEQHAGDPYADDWFTATHLAGFRVGKLEPALD
jgi:hypothetical protein